MNELVSNIVLSSLYLMAWVVTFVWYHAAKRSLDAGSVIIGMQVIYSIFSILVLIDPLFNIGFKELTLFPYIYLYGMMMLALAPVLYDHVHPTYRIAEPHTRILSIIAVVIIVCSVLQIPQVLGNASSGVLKLLTDAEAGKDAYEDQMDAVEGSGSMIRNLPAVIYNAMSDFAPFLMFYFMTLKKRKYLLSFGLFVAFAIGLFVCIVQGQRGGLIITFLTAVGAYFMFRRYLSKAINRWIQGVGLTLVVLITVPVVAITVGRFGKEAAGIGGFVNWYIGQSSLYFNNYALDAGGTRNGDRTFNLVKRVIDPSTPKNFAERRDKYRNLKIDDNFFSSFVGDFTIDFGPYIPVVMFLVFAYFMTKGIRPREGMHKVYQLLLLYFAICVSLQGGMTLFSYSDTGNLRIVMFGLLYGYLRYHEVLLEKFPLKTGTSKS